MEACSNAAPSVFERVLDGNTHLMRLIDAIRIVSPADRSGALSTAGTFHCAHGAAKRRCFYSRLAELESLRQPVSTCLHRQREITRKLGQLVGAAPNARWLHQLAPVGRLVMLQANQDMSLIQVATDSLNEAEIRDLATAYDVVAADLMRPDSACTRVGTQLASSGVANSVIIQPV